MLAVHLVQTSSQSRVSCVIRHSCSRLELVRSWKISKDGEYTIPLENRFHYSNALRWRRLFLNQRWSLSCFNLYLSPLALPVHTRLPSCSNIFQFQYSLNFKLLLNLSRRRSYKFHSNLLTMPLFYPRNFLHLQNCLELRTLIHLFDEKCWEKSPCTVLLLTLITGKENQNTKKFIKYKK